MNIYLSKKGKKILEKKLDDIEKAQEKQDKEKLNDLLGVKYIISCKSILELYYKEKESIQTLFLSMN